MVFPSTVTAGPTTTLRRLKPLTAVSGERDLTTAKWIDATPILNAPEKRRRRPGAAAFRVR